MSEPDVEPVGLAMITDQPVLREEQDRLGFAAYAGVFTAFFLDENTPTPMTVAISGPWGSGKTSLARLIDQRLGAEENWHGRWSEAPLTCWFNAWHHADAPNVGVAVAAHVARMLAPRRRVWSRVLQPLPTTMLPPSRRWWRRIWQGVAGAIVALAGLAVLVWQVPALRDELGPIGTIASEGFNPVLLFTAGSALITLATRAYRAGGVLGTYLEAPQAIAAQGAIAEVREHLGKLVSQALGRRSRGPNRAPYRGDRRLVVFIDDLERCPADKALGVCEVVTQLLDHSGVVVVMISDLAPLATAAATRYQGSDADDPPAAAGERYLDKLINMRFNLPPLSAVSVQRLFDNQPKNNHVNEAD